MKIIGKNVKISIGEVKGAAEEEKGGEEDGWEEPEGPNLKPNITDLRLWDRKLLSRYEPVYNPINKTCSFCAFGPCDLNAKRRGSCGINLETHTSREVLFLSVVGCASHAAHARHMLDLLIKEKGKNFPLNVSENTEVEAPLTRLIAGKKPEKLGDLISAMDYVEEQTTALLASLHMGQESDHIDFNSKALHAGMIDHLAMEIADICQISALGFPKGPEHSHLVDLGFGVIDKKKPVILAVGHNVSSGTEIVDFSKANNIEIEIAGLCCTAHDLARYDEEGKRAKVIGPLSYQLPYVRSGIADVIVTDEQCVRIDTIENAEKLGTPVIATSDKNAGGLEDLSHETANEIVEKLVSRKIRGAYIPDLKKAGEVAVKVAVRLHSTKKKKELKEGKLFLQESEKCTGCGLCNQACPISLEPQKIIEEVREKRKVKDETLERINKCVFCGRCESWCAIKIPIVSIFSELLKDKLQNQKAKIRAGRGAIQDVEIREVGRPIVFGEIPGVIAPVGCSLYPRGGKELVEITEEFLKRGYIVTTSGCAAMTLGIEGNLYEKYHGVFDGGNLVNVGSCVANSHITGAAIKIANIFARRPLRANFEEIADYILNRVGAVGLVWGTYSQKALAIAQGCNRLGIPVIFGPSGKKYRRELLSNEKTDWEVLDTRSGEKASMGPAPEHLLYVAKTKEEAIVMAAKLVMRVSDTVKGRQIKLAHWVDLSEKYYDKIPDDLEKFVRVEADLPMERKENLLKLLKKKGWKAMEKIPDPTLLERKVTGRGKIMDSKDENELMDRLDRRC